MKKHILILIALLFALQVTVYAQCNPKKVRKGQENAKHGQYVEANSINHHPYTIFDQANTNSTELLVVSSLPHLPQETWNF